jgi:hypothetical protein
MASTSVVLPWSTWAMIAMLRIVSRWLHLSILPCGLHGPLSPVPPGGRARSRRSGVRDHLLGLAHVYPFRCQLCTTRFRAFQARQPRRSARTAGVRSAAHEDCR